MNSSILILTCGGTFDKNKFTRSGKFVCGDSEINRILAGAGSKGIEHKEIMHKDSLDMDDADRSALADAVAEASQTRIVIVHGTDTMVQTAESLAEKKFAKTIVLTGSMRPAVFTGSDADFNLGFALGAAGILDAGTWIAMHGELFAAAEAAKDIERGRFYRKQQQGS